MKLVLIAILLCVAAAQTPTPMGVLVQMADGHTVELAVQGQYSFRASVSYEVGVPAASISSYMIDETTTPASFKITNNEGAVLVVPNRIREFVGALIMSLTLPVACSQALLALRRLLARCASIPHRVLFSCSTTPTMC
jgi:hypothetical protein